jgi:hypothetical protein
MWSVKLMKKQAYLLGILNPFVYYQLSIIVFDRSTDVQILPNEVVCMRKLHLFLFSKDMKNTPKVIQSVHENYQIY